MKTDTRNFRVRHCHPAQHVRQHSVARPGIHLLRGSTDPGPELRHDDSVRRMRSLQHFLVFRLTLLDHIHTTIRTLGIKKHCPSLCQHCLQLCGTTTQSPVLSHAIPIPCHCTRMKTFGMKTMHLSHNHQQSTCKLNASFQYAETLRAVIQVFTEFFRPPYFCTIMMICSKCLRVSSSAALWPRGPLMLPCHHPLQSRLLEPRLTPVHTAPLNFTPSTPPHGTPDPTAYPPRPCAPLRPCTHAEHEFAAHYPGMCGTYLRGLRL
jgi:hypothetical protein